MCGFCFQKSQFTFLPASLLHYYDYEEEDFDYDAMRRDFDMNGTECELDELDKLEIKASRQRDLASKNVDPAFLQILDGIRTELSRLRPLPGRKNCVFCKKNKEREGVYTTHVLKDNLGRIVCPILQRYACPMCGATGNKAHTVKYCPLNYGMESVDAVFHTPRSGCGKQRH